MKKNKIDMVIIFLLVLLPSVAAAQPEAAANQDMLVDNAWLSQHRAGITVVDVRDETSYLEGHIPGAVSIPLSNLQSSPDAILFPVAQLEKKLGEDGLNIDSDVVVYGEGEEIAFREYWAFDYLGMKRLHLLDGGIEAWKGKLSTSVKTLAPSAFKAKPDRRKYATTRYVKAGLHKPGIILLDVRTPREYKGTDVRSLRGGHIPGAINISHKQNFEPGATLLKPLSELAGIYGKLDRKKEIITYCQTGTRAASTYFVLKELGFPKIRNYDDSWIVWGSRLDLPADDVSYFNFVTVLKTLKKLQKEIEQKEENK